MREKTPETIVTEQVIEVLHLKGYTVKKIYNGGVPATVRFGKIVYKTKKGEYKGIPDLIAYNQDKFFFIEIKRKKGKVKPEQSAFIDSFNLCKKFEAVVIRDIDELQESIFNK